MAWIKFLVQAVIVFAASIALWVWLGPQIYLIVSTCVTLVVFALVMTSDARSATSSNPNPEIELRAVPWAAWAFQSLIIAIILGAFWPLMPLSFSIQRHDREERKRRAFERWKHEAQSYAAKHTSARVDDASAPKDTERL